MLTTYFPKIRINDILTRIYSCNVLNMPILVAARSKAWVCGHSLAGIVGSNPAGGVNVCLLRVLCVVR